MKLHYNQGNIIHTDAHTRVQRDIEHTHTYTHTRAASAIGMFVWLLQRWFPNVAAADCKMLPVSKQKAAYYLSANLICSGSDNDDDDNDRGNDDKADNDDNNYHKLSLKLLLLSLSSVLTLNVSKSQTNN